MGKILIEERGGLDYSLIPAQWIGTTMLGVDQDDSTMEYAIYLELVDDDYQVQMEIQIPTNSIVDVFKTITLLRDKGYVDELEDIEITKLSNNTGDEP